jgi:anti-anti-sigma factor
MSAPGQHTDDIHDSLRFAELGDGIAVIQVHGRGSLANSVTFQKLAEHLAEKYGPGKYSFIVDLENCETMDSTFLGALASVALRQLRECKLPLAIVHANEHTRRLLDTLGLSNFVKIGAPQADDAGAVPEGAQFQEAEVLDVPRIERIVHMIQAHERLCEVDSENEARFQNVLKYLKESLDREREAAQHKNDTQS